jgi:hypothetical protein
VTHGDSDYVSWCPDCCKRIFAGRRAARKKAHQVPGRRMHAYPCPAGRGWHLGHLPKSVVHGKVPKGVYLANVERRRGEP